MTGRHRSQLPDLVSLLSSLYFLKHPISIRNLIIFSTSESFPSSVLMSPWILCFFLLSLHQGQSCIKCFIASLQFPHAAFLHVCCQLFHDIKCLWVSLVSVSNTYPTQFDLVLPTVIVGIFPFFNAWFNVVQLTFIVFPFLLPLGVFSHPNGQVVI